MDNFSKQQILKLGDNKEYIIIETINFNNKKYLYLIEIDEEEELTDNFKIVYIVKDMKNNYGVLEINDPTELVEVTEIFIPMIEIEYK